MVTAQGLINQGKIIAEAKRAMRERQIDSSKRFVKKLPSKVRSGSKQIKRYVSTKHPSKSSGVIRGLANMAFPTTQRSNYQGKKGYASRGRPKGTVKYKDDQGRPIDVFTWRRLQSAKRALIRYNLRAVQAKEQSERLPQYERQQYQPSSEQMDQQQPQQVQYQQPQQVQYQQPQYVAPQQQRRPIGTPFRSSGGRPYEPVPQERLAHSQTYADAVETVDLMSGRRYFKPKPRPEGWMR